MEEIYNDLTSPKSKEFEKLLNNEFSKSKIKFCFKKPQNWSHIENLTIPVSFENKSSWNFDAPEKRLQRLELFNYTSMDERV